MTTNFLFQRKNWEHDQDTVIGTLNNNTYQVYEMYFGNKVFYYVILNNQPRFLEKYEIKHIKWKFKSNTTKPLFSFI